MRGFESIAMARIVQVPSLHQDPLSSMHIRERSQHLPFAKRKNVGFYTGVAEYRDELFHTRKNVCPLRVYKRVLG